MNTSEMSTNLHKPDPSSTPLRSASNSRISDDDDDVSDGSTNKEDYENDTFEEESVEEMSLSSLERLREPRRTKSVPNKTFTPTQIREIERENAILMNKILTYSRKPTKPKVASLPNKYHMTSAAINRKKNQMKIDWENQILLRKIQSVKPSIRY